MTENYLHFLWKNKRIPLINVELNNQQIISVNNYGVYNENKSGPDFKFGSLLIDNVEIHGHIEMHVKSSDWFKHKHHHDKNYNNVILHVVYENDGEVIQNGYNIPTLELKEYINLNDYSRYLELEQSEFPCSYGISSVDPFHLEFMKNQSLIDRLNGKLKELDSLNGSSPAAVLYNLIGVAFGTSINSRQFKILLDNCPYDELKGVPAFNKYDSIVFRSGIENESNISLDYHWNYKGTRPQNFPTKRVRQFATLVEQFNFEISFEKMSVSVIVKTFQKMVNECWLENSKIDQVSSSFINHLLINAIAPYLWFMGNENRSVELQSRAIDLLEFLPPERNRITKRWAKLNISMINAFDTQALLALHKYYCCHKKCLSCEVGKKVLNRID